MQAFFDSFLSLLIRPLLSELCLGVNDTYLREIELHPHNLLSTLDSRVNTTMRTWASSI